jgi:hypothetical protein
VGDQVTLKYLKEFRERVSLEELPQWECYRRPERTPTRDPIKRPDRSE